MKNLWVNHKLGISTAVISIVAVILGVLVTPAAAASVVKLVGFGPAGPIPGTWAAREQDRIRDIMKPSTFAVAQSIGMGGSIPWYARAYGGFILGILVLVACGLIMLIMLAYRRIFRRSGRDFQTLPENESNQKRSSFA